MKDNGRFVSPEGRVNWGNVVIKTVEIGLVAAATRGLVGEGQVVQANQENQPNIQNIQKESYRQKQVKRGEIHVQSIRLKREGGPHIKAPVERADARRASASFRQERQSTKRAGEFQIYQTDKKIKAAGNEVGNPQTNISRAEYSHLAELQHAAPVMADLATAISRFVQHEHLERGNITGDEHNPVVNAMKEVKDFFENGTQSLKNQEHNRHEVEKIIGVLRSVPPNEDLKFSEQVRAEVDKLPNGSEAWELIMKMGLMGRLLTVQEGNGKKRKGSPEKMRRIALAVVALAIFVVACGGATAITAPTAEQSTATSVALTGTLSATAPSVEIAPATGTPSAIPPSWTPPPPPSATPDKETCVFRISDLAARPDGGVALPKDGQLQKLDRPDKWSPDQAEKIVGAGGEPLVDAMTFISNTQAAADQGLTLAEVVVSEGCGAGGLFKNGDRIFWGLGADGQPIYRPDGDGFAADFREISRPNISSGEAYLVVEKDQVLFWKVGDKLVARYNPILDTWDAINPTPTPLPSLTPAASETPTPLPTEILTPAPPDKPDIAVDCRANANEELGPCQGQLTEKQLLDIMQKFAKSKRPIDVIPFDYSDEGPHKVDHLVFGKSFVTPTIAAWRIRQEGTETLLDALMVETEFGPKGLPGPVVFRVEIPVNRVGWFKGVGQVEYATPATIGQIKDQMDQIQVLGNNGSSLEAVVWNGALNTSFDTPDVDTATAMQNAKAETEKAVVAYKQVLAGIGGPFVGVDGVKAVGQKLGEGWEWWKKGSGVQKLDPVTEGGEWILTLSSY